MKSFKILIIDDEEDMLDSCQRILEHYGYECLTAASGKKGVESAEHYRPDAIITDLRMAEMNGLDVLMSCRKIDPEVIVIILTAFATVQNAVDAMKLGANDYIQKPFTAEQLITSVRRHLHSRIPHDTHQIKTDTSPQQLILGRSPKIKEILCEIKRFAQSDANVLITGESGTGKELAAHQIHRLSLRKNNPIIPVDCACLPEELLESELFGHVKGAFTSANTNKAGLLNQANGGTLFFDELSHLTPRGQAKLLRVLQERKYRPVGGKKLISIDLRVVSATNRDLKHDIQAGVFREDLFFRLNVLSLHLPPLRERKEDIPILIDYFIKKHKSNKTTIEMTLKAMNLLMQYDWPGNIRELENTILRCLAIVDNGHIEPSHLPEALQNDQVNVPLSDEMKLPDSIKSFERIRILDALRNFNGERIKAARALGISRKSLWQKMKQYNILDDEIKNDQKVEKAT